MEELNKALLEEKNAILMRNDYEPDLVFFSKEKYDSWFYFIKKLDNRRNHSKKPSSYASQKAK